MKGWILITVASLIQIFQKEKYLSVLELNFINVPFSSFRLVFGRSKTQVMTQPVVEKVEGKRPGNFNVPSFKIGMIEKEIENVIEKAKEKHPESFDRFDK